MILLSLISIIIFNYPIRPFICNPIRSKIRHAGWNFLGPQIALQMTCNGQIAEANPNEHVLAGALQGNLQFSPNFFWNFSHHIHIFLTLSQDFLSIFWIFQPQLVPRLGNYTLEQLTLEQIKLAIDQNNLIYRRIIITQVCKKHWKLSNTWRKKNCDLWMNCGGWFSY